MKNLRTDETTRHAADARAELSPRPLARSLVLYAVLGTLALQVGGVQPSRAQEQQPTPPQQQQQGARTEVTARPRVNAAPLKEIIRQAAGMHRRGELNLTDPSAFVLEADVKEDGGLESVKTSFTGGDVALEGFAHRLVEALSESRAFGAMEGVTHVRLALALDGRNFNADAAVSASTPEQAERLSSDYNTLLHLARVAKRNRPESAVFNNMTVSASGKQLSLKLDMTREALGNLLLRQVAPN